MIKIFDGAHALREHALRERGRTGNAPIRHARLYTEHHSGLNGSTAGGAARAAVVAPLQIRLLRYIHPSARSFARVSATTSRRRVLEEVMQ